MKKDKLQRIFLFLILLVIGLVLTIFIPFFAKPDEPAHFERAIEVSEGKLFCKNNEKFKTFYNTEYLYQMASKYNLTGNPYILPLNIFKVGIFNDIKPKEIEKNTRYCNFPFFGYIFNALGIKIGVLLNFHPLVIFYFGRLLNFLILFTSLSYFIFTEKHYFWPFFITLSLPQTLHQLGAYSYDGVTIAFSLFALLFFLRKKYSIKNLILIIIFSLVGIYVKNFLYFFILFPLSFLYLINNKKIKINLKNFFIFLIFFILFFLIIVFKFKELLLIFFNNSYKNSISPGLQFKIVYENPSYFINSLIFALQEKFNFYFTSIIGNLEWLDVYLDHYVYILYAGLIAITIYKLTISKNTFNKLTTFIFVSITFIQIIFIYFFMFLTWTNTGTTNIEGVQGRYFLPFFPAILISISCILNYLLKKINLATIFYLIILFSTITVVYNRHYNYSKAIEFNREYKYLSNKIKFNQQSPIIEKKVKIEQYRKLAAFLIILEKNGKKLINNPPLYFDVKDENCQKKIRRVIIPANSLKEKENYIFIKPLRTKNNDNLCVSLTTPASAFSESLTLKEIIDVKSKEKSFFYPQYLWR